MNITAVAKKNNLIQSWEYGEANANQKIRNQYDY